MAVTFYMCICVYSSAIQKQLACILGRQQIFFELDEEADNADLMEHMRNTQLNTHFLNLAREVMNRPKLKYTFVTGLL